jgi:hypothetical protein
MSHYLEQASSCLSHRSNKGPEIPVRPSKPVCNCWGDPSQSRIIANADASNVNFWAFFRSEFLVPFLQLFCARFSPLFCLLLRRISGPFFVIYLRPFLGFIRPSFHHFYGHHDAAFLTVGSSRLPISVGSRRGVRLFMSWPFPVHGSWHFHLRRGLSSIGPGRVCLRYVAGVS